MGIVYHWVVIKQNPDELMLKVLGALSESQARWYVARETLALGRGGLKAMNELTGMSRPTILKGIRELQQHKELPSERIRQPGGGRKRLEESDQGLEAALEQIMEENTAGDPMSLFAMDEQIDGADRR
jgi:hypothetical protein